MGRSPEAGDLVSEDRVHFCRNGQLVLTIQVRIPPSRIGERGTRTRDADEGEVTPSAMWRQLDAFMHKNRISARVWLLDEAGDATPLSPPKRVRKQSPQAYARHRIAIAAAERRYGDDGPVLDGGAHAHWPAHVQRMIRRLAERR